MSETWMVVKRSRTIPGGYRVVRFSLTEKVARELAASYARPHEAMKTSDLYALRRAALAAAEPSPSSGESERQA